MHSKRSQELRRSIGGGASLDGGMGEMGVGGPLLEPGEVDMSEANEISGTPSEPGLASILEGALLLPTSRLGMTQGSP